MKGWNERRKEGNMRREQYLVGDTHMTKVAFLVVRLVPESETVNNETIEKEIQQDSQIPWNKQIEKVTVLKCDSYE